MTSSPLYMEWWWWDTINNDTLFEIFIFCPKIQLWFPEKVVDFWGVKTRENVVVLDFLALDFDFTRKNVKKIWVKTREMISNSVIYFLKRNPYIFPLRQNSRPWLAAPIAAGSGRIGRASS